MYSCEDESNETHIFKFLRKDKKINKHTEYHKKFNGDARSVMVIVIGNGHSDTSSNPG